MGNDNGWDFLNSDDDNTSFSSHNADGSYGYKNSDGSASYYGSDGSWGYKNSDGSTTYYGADGSWGYRNSDGSGSYYGSDNSAIYYDAKDDINEDDRNYDNSAEDSSGGMGLAAGLLGMALGLGAAAYAKHRAQEEYEECWLEEECRKEERILEEKRIEKEKEKQLRKKRIKAFFFNKKNLQIDFSTDDLVGDDYVSVLNILKDTGFNNIKVVPIKDIYEDSNCDVGEVAQVVIGGQSLVEEGDLIPYDAEIIITYHMKKEFPFPYSPRKMKKRDYRDLVEELFDIGYTEIYTKEINDLKIGWIVKDGSVQQVKIRGESSFKKGTLYEYDTKIIIEYHTFTTKKVKEN